MSKEMLKRLRKRLVMARNFRIFKQIKNEYELMRHAEVKTTKQTYKAERKQ